MNRRSWGVSTLLVAMTAVMTVGSTLSLATPASADVRPYGGYDPPNDAFVGTEPDRGSHTYCFRSTNTPNDVVRDRISWSMGTLQDQTIVDVLFHSDGCTAQTDARWEQVYIGNHVYGATNCVNFNSANNCDQWRIRVAYGEIQDDASDPPPQVRKTTCHELGHTVGFAHYGNNDPYANPPDGAGIHGCMRSGLWDGGQDWTKRYGSHHVNHVNGNW